MEAVVFNKYLWQIFNIQFQRGLWMFLLFWIYPTHLIQLELVFPPQNELWHHTELCHKLVLEYVRCSCPLLICTAIQFGHFLMWVHNHFTWLTQTLYLVWIGSWWLQNCRHNITLHYFRCVKSYTRCLHPWKSDCKWRINIK